MFGNNPLSPWMNYPGAGSNPYSQPNGMGLPLPRGSTPSPYLGFQTPSAPVMTRDLRYRFDPLLSASHTNDSQPQDMFAQITQPLGAMQSMRQTMSLFQPQEPVIGDPQKTGDGLILDTSNPIYGAGPLQDPLARGVQHIKNWFMYGNG